MGCRGRWWQGKEKQQGGEEVRGQTATAHEADGHEEGGQSQEVERVGRRRTGPTRRRDVNTLLCLPRPACLVSAACCFQGLAAPPPPRVYRSISSNSRGTDFSDVSASVVPYVPRVVQQSGLGHPERY